MDILPPCALSSNLGEGMANKEGLGVGGLGFGSWELDFLRIISINVINSFYKCYLL